MDTAAGLDTAGRETPPGVETDPGGVTLLAGGVTLPAVGTSLGAAPGATNGLVSSSKASFCLARLAACTAARSSSIFFAVAAAVAAAAAATLSASAAALEEGEKKDPCAFLEKRTPQQNPDRKNARGRKQSSRGRGGEGRGQRTCKSTHHEYKAPI